MAELATSVAIEQVGSRAINVDKDNPAVDLLYILNGSFDEYVIRLALEQELPLAWFIRSAKLPGGGIKVSFSNYRVDHIGNAVWTAAARYGGRDPKRCHAQLSFSTGGQTTHIARSKKTLRRFTIDHDSLAKIDAPDMSGAINVNNDTVQGVEIGLAAFRWTETWTMPTTKVTTLYQHQLEEFTYTVNAEPFRGKKAGEVLIENITGGEKNYGEFEITFHFARSRNAKALRVGPMAHPFRNDLYIEVDKGGWEYLWIQWTNHVNNPTNAVTALTVSPTARIKKVKSVYVEQVYDYADFSKLGIGVLPLEIEDCANIPPFNPDSLGNEDPIVISPPPIERPSFPIFNPPVAR